MMSNFLGGGGNKNASKNRTSFMHDPLDHNHLQILVLEAPLAWHAGSELKRFFLELICLLSLRINSKWALRSRENISVE